MLLHCRRYILASVPKRDVYCQPPVVPSAVLGLRWKWVVNTLLWWFISCAGTIVVTRIIHPFTCMWRSSLLKTTLSREVHDSMDFAQILLPYPWGISKYRIYDRTSADTRAALLTPSGNWCRTWESRPIFPYGGECWMSREHSKAALYRRSFQCFSHRLRREYSVA